MYSNEDGLKLLFLQAKVPKMTMNVILKIHYIWYILAQKLVINIQGLLRKNRHILKNSLSKILFSRNVEFIAVDGVVAFIIGAVVAVACAVWLFTQAYAKWRSSMTEEEKAEEAKQKKEKQEQKAKEEQEQQAKKNKLEEGENVKESKDKMDSINKDFEKSSSSLDDILKNMQNVGKENKEDSENKEQKNENNGKNDFQNSQNNSNSNVNSNGKLGLPDEKNDKNPILPERKMPKIGENLHENNNSVQDNSQKLQIEQLQQQVRDLQSKVDANNELIKKSSNNTDRNSEGKDEQKLNMKQVGDLLHSNDGANSLMNMETIHNAEQKQVGGNGLL